MLISFYLWGRSWVLFYFALPSMALCISVLRYHTPFFQEDEKLAIQEHMGKLMFLMKNKTLANN
jgi:hypothetical protein